MKKLLIRAAVALLRPVVEEIMRRQAAENRALREKLMREEGDRIAAAGKPMSPAMLRAVTGNGWLLLKRASG